MIRNSNRVDTTEYSKERLGIDFTTKRPISADDLADSFKGLASLYRKEVALKTNSEFLEGEEFVLYITKIESKCIYTELAAYVGAALPVIQAMDYMVTIDAFYHRFASLMEFFSSPSRPKLAHQSSIPVVSLSTAKDFEKILRAAGGGGIKLDTRVSTSETEHTVVQSFEYLPPQVMSATEGVKEFIAEHSEKEEADFKMVSLYFDRINRDKLVGARTTPELGRIDAISPRSLPVRWVSDLDDKRVKSVPNRFDLAFNVDVKVDYARGRAVAYRVLKLHDWIDILGDQEPDQFDE